MEDKFYNLKGIEWIPFVMKPYYERTSLDNVPSDAKPLTNEDFDIIRKKTSNAGLYQLIAYNIALLGMAAGALYGLEKLLE